MKLSAQTIWELQQMVAGSVPFSIRPEQFVYMLAKAYPHGVTVKELQVFYGALAGRDPVSSFIEFIQIYRIVRDRLAAADITVERTDGTPNAMYRLKSRRFS